MSYVEKVLQPGERVLARSRLHWIIYRSTALYLVLAAVAVAFIPQNQAPLPEAVAGVLLLLALLTFLSGWIRRSTTELAVTNARVIYKTGIFSRRTIEMNRARVESVDVLQTIPGRIFGYGTIVVRGTGGSLEPMRTISDPLNFRSQVTAAE